MNSKYPTFEADLCLGKEDGNGYRYGAYKQDKMFRRTQFSPSGKYLMQAVTVETRSEMVIQLRITDFMAQTYHHYCTGPLHIQRFHAPSKIITCYWTTENTIGIWIDAQSSDGGTTTRFMHQLSVIVDHEAKTTRCVSSRVFFNDSGRLPHCSTTNPIVIGRSHFIVFCLEQKLLLVPYYFDYVDPITITYPKDYGQYYTLEDRVAIYENKVFFQTNKKERECNNGMLYLDLNSLDISVDEHELDDFKKAVFIDKGYHPSFIKSHRKSSVQVGRYIIRWAGDLRNRDTELYIVDLKELRIINIAARIAGFDSITILNDSLLMFRNISVPRISAPLDDMHYICIPNVVSYSKGTVISLRTAALNAVLMSDAYDVEDRELCNKLFHEGVID